MGENSMYKGFNKLLNIKGPIPTRTIVYKRITDGKLIWHNQPVGFDDNNSDLRNPSHKTLTPYNDNDDYLLDCMDIEDNYEIFPTKSGKFLTAFHLPSPLIPIIIGPKGKKLRELQDMTQTLIKVPRILEKGVPIKITGPNERSVASARNQITILALAKRENFPSTHFVSIPINSRDIKDNFQKFKLEILKGPALRGIDESIFQNPDKLHLTIEVLTLLDDIEIDHAKNLLSENIKNFICNIMPKKRYDIILKGIEIMNDDPTEVDVLYAKVGMVNAEDNENFQEFVDNISSLFYKNGYVRKQYDNVKLHVTLMNSLFRKEKEDGKRTTFEATPILKKYENYNFGKSVFSSIELSIRYSTGKNGYYESVISIPM